MLYCMTIDNIALINHADIEFSDGFNVFSGETGAGKSILIGSMNMLLGERVSKEFIRFGEKKAMVQGLFKISDESVLSYLSENGIDAEEDGSLIISRELSAEGKNICRAGGKMLPVSKLKELGRMLMNIHGQHDNQALLDKTTHLEFLDRFIGDKAEKLLADYKEKYKQLVALLKEADELDIDEAEKLRRIDILKYEIKELSDAQLAEGEEEELKKQRVIANNAKKLMLSAGQALDVLYENADGECAYNFLANASSLAQEAAEIDSELSEVSESIESALVTVEDTVRRLQAYLNNFEQEGISIDEIEERLDLIYRLKRKYGGNVESAIRHLENSIEELKNIEFLDERKIQIENEISICRSEAEKLATKLSELRKSSAKDLSSKICESLEFLNMPNAEFVAEIVPKDLSADGIDAVEFLLSANKGEPAKPLEKIVSGGELSRIMLAIKSILADSDVVDTLIFDEVDSGVSGRAAQKLGEKLKELSNFKQIFCVTHLAQVASKAESHFLIEKHEENEKTLTKVNLLDKKGRINELARIIGGEKISDTTLKQAEEMLND
ncbi:MAG: DNA repair protein RecN [Clostridia bacterium]|nr:DNA repair protein RecN [Clostridia bacterium]